MMIKKAKLLLFQQDLKDGMSIEEALKKHGVQTQIITSKLTY